MAMFLKLFGRDRRPETLSQRDWDRFIRERRAGPTHGFGPDVPLYLPTPGTPSGSSSHHHSGASGRSRG